ncbi:hypothetical protein LY28_01760 [Ruminiclostridium sufflavum DSM 19573]|uniref:Uncharacterized protein n=1 Tax=Ruminiclostridium sufflavum DSM 19573 TaxID=1121337 RepID=A0A318XKN0_9FIRM|nr:hypothetical protein [Ruminiclostridium sufflavum]PYG87740.1 hypothetical protein LY28_01760 [Ruminiclostridium sufflavum DSM 19573]
MAEKFIHGIIFYGSSILGSAIFEIEAYRFFQRFGTKLEVMLL